MLKKIVLTISLIFSSYILAQEPLHYFLGKDFFDGMKLYSIIQDKDNTMWITSNKGVFHYDGITFETISIELSERDSFFGLTKDNNGTIYCYNFQGQIFKIINKNLELFYTIPSDKIGNYFSINFDNLNNLIVTSSGLNMLITPDKRTKIQTKNRGLFSVKRNDTLYYTSPLKNKNIGIISYINDTETVYKKLPTKIAIPLLHSKLYFHQDELYCFETLAKKFYKIENGLLIEIALSLPKNKEYGSFYSNNYLWLTPTKGGVYKVNPENTSKKNVLWFKDYVISGVYTDFENNTWLLTFDNGIIIIPNLKVSNFKIPNENISGIEKINQKIYVSSKQNTIYNFKNETFVPIVNLKNDRLESFNIFQDKNIITSSRSIYKGSTAFKNIINFNRGTVLVNNSIFSAMHNGLSKFDLTTNKLKKIYSHRANDICLSSKSDNIYFSSNNGLYGYDFSKVHSIKYQGKNIKPRNIVAVENDVWVSSKQGIYIVRDNKIIKKITTQDGLLSNNIEVIKYEQPNVYFTNPKGFQQYNTKTNTFKNLAEDYKLTKSIKDFEVLNDTVYATTSNGLLTFKFTDIKPKITHYKTSITEAIANGNKIFKNNTSLLPIENNVAFSFLTTSHRYQKRLDYNYQLIGYDKHSIKAKEGQYIVNYSNLPAGKYTFSVQSSINSQQNEVATLQFSIQQHWYKKNIFKIIIAFFLVSILYLTYSNRVKAIERKRKEEQIEKEIAASSLTSLKAQMNPHFIFNAMNSVQSLILKDKKDDAYTYLTKLSQLIRKTLTISDKNWVYLDEEIDHLNNYLELEKLRFYSDFSYHIHLDETLKELKIPSMIIQPFVENAIKHGLLHKDGKKTVQISFKLKRQTLQCIIEDNGIGRATSNEINKLKPDYQKSFSTNAIQKRFDLYKQYLNEKVGFEYIDLYDKNTPIGTRVIITIPYQTDDK